MIGSVSLAFPTASPTIVVFVVLLPTDLQEQSAAALLAAVVPSRLPTVHALSPIALLQLALPIWLIVRGFGPRVSTPGQLQAV